MFSTRHFLVLLCLLCLSSSGPAAAHETDSDHNIDGLCSRAFDTTARAESIYDLIEAEPDPKARVERIKALEWSSLPYSEQERFIEKIPTVQNSFEIGAYIRLAAASKDLRFVPILNQWVSEWAPILRGWQTYLRTDAQAALASLSGAAVAPSFSESHSWLGERYLLQVKERRMAALRAFDPTAEMWSQVEKDTRERIGRAAVFFTPHALERMKERSISEKSVWEVLESPKSKVARFEMLDRKRDSAVFRWKGRDRGEHVVQLIFALSTEGMHVITAFGADLPYYWSSASYDFY